ncbi:DUF2795 domain-containing protein [Streptomyces minutiscleroticus]|uniref:DUF2795 domain-containing protein n=1 Tax=Streptomyces minutiscleroticus TaxID=68238 RepID=A0A918NGE3_9ACTN|nr:DUF2795 domain-containing protein [Streptomyces minutiscleroticus]GGX71095.1 hypothetical protein GCM10010358_26950 [Streptomyces minutiscleroticus]
MERGSNPVSRRKDDEMKHELQGHLRSGQHTHVEEAVDPEPEADDDIRLTRSGPVPPPGPERERAQRQAEDQELHLEMARHLDRTVYPADRGTLLRALEERQAPDPLVQAARDLPEKGTYHNAHEIVSALRHRSS